MNRNSKNKFQFWMNDELSDKVKKDCLELRYKNKSEFLRDILNRSFMYVHLIKDVISEYRKQGTNLNQLAKHLNTYNIRQEDVEFLKDEIEKIKLNGQSIISKLERLRK